MNKNNIYCYNCGIYGHLCKVCHLPIISTGIICFKQNQDILNFKKNQDMLNFKDNLRFIMIKRRYTLGYTNFIRGQYNLEKKSLLNLVNIMTIEEKHKIISDDFENLWKDLWLINDIHNAYFNEFEKSNEKFNELKNTSCKDINLLAIIGSSNTNYIEQEWGFPKGRRDKDETNLECGIREFEEETNINHNQYKLLNLKPIVEDFMGTDNKKYRNIYYIAEYTDKDDTIFLSNNQFQLAEISDVKFMSFNEIKDHIRPYNGEKLNVLESLINSLKFIYNII